MMNYHKRTKRNASEFKFARVPKFGGDDDNGIKWQEKCAPSDVQDIRGQRNSVGRTRNWQIVFCFDQQCKVKPL
jgi:hypothetical protein